MTRRSFLKSAAASAAMIAAPSVLRSQSASSTLTTAMIGCGWWGGLILNEAMRAGRSKLIALCDVDQDHLNKTAEDVSKASSDSPKKYTDYREMLARERPQIVICATPDHWHSRITVD